jgi:integrase
MLINCPECNNEVSDQAYMCPRCGFPITATKTVTKQRKASKKRKRLPNGFGSITEIKSKNLRNRFWARVTVGRDSVGKPIQKSLKPEAYFETYEEAFEALCEFKKNPYDLEPDITVLELYEKWSHDYFKTLSSTTSERTITAAWNYCSAIYDMRAKDVRARHLKGCMEEGFRIETKGKNKGEKIFASAGTKSRMKSMFNLMFDYAVEYEIVDKNYARTFEVSGDVLKEREEAKIDHITFKSEEMDKLWRNVENLPYTDIILIQCYSGWRPQELGLIKLTDVDLENWTFKGGMKTTAGKDRLVPIHSKIQHLVESRYREAVEMNSDYLFNCTDAMKSGKFFSYDKYRVRFTKIMTALELDQRHRPHDPRKTFITLAKESDVNEHVIKLLVGHSDKDITESTYTERSVANLRKEIEKIN